MIRHSFARIGNIHLLPPTLIISHVFTRSILESNRINPSFIRNLAISSLRYLSASTTPSNSSGAKKPLFTTNGKLEAEPGDNTNNDDTATAASTPEKTITLDSPFALPPGSEKVLPEGVSKDDFLTEVFGSLDPYIDTYAMYKDLRGAGFSVAQSDQIIALLIYQLNLKLTKLSTIYAQRFELENEQYLFESAQQEIRVDVTRSRDQHAAELLALINILLRDFNAITDELHNDFLMLRNDSAVAINEAKSENTLLSKRMFLKIQEANHKITTDLSSNIKSEIESLRWYLSRWGLMTLLASLFMALIIFYSSKQKNVTEEARREFAPLVIREPSEYEDDDYHTELDRASV
ncbi:hypothetical protein Cantr_04145 [Candida viswanathii]|uniref:Uncharacterized protein n=1 Tax=Candida viswanathii TaxID=5486 RepID=A0A367XP51_9ASCO|nr:hypothetical protein Cantr_04145 [Candida viswanathii]